MASITGLRDPNDVPTASRPPCIIILLGCLLYHLSRFLSKPCSWDDILCPLPLSPSSIQHTHTQTNYFCIFFFKFNSSAVSSKLSFLTTIFPQNASSRSVVSHIIFLSFWTLSKFANIHWIVTFWYGSLTSLMAGTVPVFYVLLSPKPWHLISREQ